jgi:hypothetical protein
LGSHLREEGSLDYDGGLVRLQVQLKFDMNIHRQQSVIQGLAELVALLGFMVVIRVPWALCLE